MKLELLGGISPKKFLRNYWQKKPFWCAERYPAFRACSPGTILSGLLAGTTRNPDLLLKEKGDGRSSMGLFHLSVFSRLPKKQWTLLVQDVNHFLPSARDLLLEFNFISSFPAG